MEYIPTLSDLCIPFVCLLLTSFIYVSLLEVVTAYVIVINMLMWNSGSIGGSSKPGAVRAGYDIPTDF